MKTTLSAIGLFAVLACVPAFAQDDLQLPHFELKDGDRVVFLGSEFVEQAIKHNYLEAELTARWPQRRAQFFNMGWSGDTPTAIARGYFGGAEEGYRRLVAELDRIRPTVIFLYYGCNFDGESQQQFSRDFEKLYRQAQSYTGRVVIVTPPPVESHPNPRPNASLLNSRRRMASTAMRFLYLSDSDNSLFVNLYSSMIRRMQVPSGYLTWDGLRFRAEGYRLIADLTLRLLRVPQTGARESLSDEEFDELRRMIGEKNQLYFHRYRPQNETYLRGFRRHEQGQNAAEIASYDKLIALAEDRIYAHLNGDPLPPPIPEPPPVELAFEALDPEAERADFTLAEGLQINLFASEPMVANPIHMNFDGRGRLWVATSPIYPQIRPGAKPRDEIVILEDTDGDGVADKRTVFANDLLIPTAVLPDEQGGAYVANSTELLHLTDEDGDGRADSRRVVLAGFGTEDTHHILHTFRWGPDAAFYFNQSIYIHTHAETNFGVRRLMGSGIWRFRPERGYAEVMMRGLVNPWGHVFDNYGQSFATDGAGGDGINYAFVGAAYPTAVGFSRTLRGMNPGQPKHCGLEIITGRHWPDDWQGTLVTNDFRGNRINRFRLSERESGYDSQQLPDLLTSRHRAFRPVDLKLGPDNALYIADWYNPIINHGEVDFRDPRRDYKHGRIWRVTMADRPLVEPPKFDGASPQELLAMLSVPEQRTRQLARIEIRNRHRFDDQLALTDWVDSLSEAQADQKLEALWTWEALLLPREELLKELLQAADHRHRAAAVRTLGHWSDRIPEALALMERAVEDEHPQVRLEALAALRTRPSKRAAELAMRVLDKPVDQYLDFALWVTMRELEPQWFPALADGGVDFQKDSRKLLFALRAVGKSTIADPLVRLLRSSRLKDSEWKEVVDLVGEFGGPQHLDRVFEIALSQPSKRPVALGALVSAARARRVRPTADLDRLQELEPNPQVLLLAGLWRVEAMHPLLIETATEGQGPMQLAAIQGLGAMRDADTLVALIDGPQSLSVRRAAIAALAEIDLKLASSRAANFLASLPADGAGEAAALVGIFVGRRGGAAALASALREVRLSEPIAAAGSRRASSAGRNGKELADVFRAVGSITPMKTRLSPAELADLIEEVTQKGDPVRGEVIYRRSELGCIKCHSIGGAGGVVGSDLVSLGASSPVDYIVESMLDPSAKIKEGYHTTTILTADGKQVSGRVVLEDADKLVLRDAENQQHVIAKADIDERIQSPTSLMPADLVAKLPRADFVDLIAFLSSLGKDGPFKVPANRYVRRWLLEDGSTVFSRVDGTLPVSDIRGSSVTAEIEVTSPGPVALHVEDPEGLRITRNELQDNLRAERVIQDLPAGRHRFTFRVPARRSAPLRVEIIDVPQSAGRAEPVNRE